MRTGSCNVSSRLTNENQRMKVFIFGAVAIGGWLY